MGVIESPSYSADLSFAYLWVFRALRELRANFWKAKAKEYRKLHSLSVDINRYLRGTTCIPLYTRPIDEPERIGLGVSPERRIVMPVPVVVQAGFDLEPLAGEAGVERLRAGDQLRLTSLDGAADSRPRKGLGRSERAVSRWRSTARPWRRRSSSPTG